MSGVIGANAISVLRLLTTREINRITGATNGKKKVSDTTKLISDEDSSLISAEGSSNTELQTKNQDNVLQFKKENEQPEQKQDPYKEAPLKALKTDGNEKKVNAEKTIQKDSVEATNSSTNLEMTKEQSMLEKAGVFSAEKIRMEEEKRRKKIKESEDSATVFLLKERDKTKESQKKLKTIEVLKSYKENRDMSIQKNSEDDLNASDNQGILLNKKHF